MEICGRGGRMPAARVEQKNGMTKEDKNGVIPPLTKKAPYKRFETPREGTGQGRQCAGTAGADPVALAFPGVPERQCAGALVSHADRGAERRAQDDDDRGTGAQTADSAVAPGHDRRGAGRCRAAAGGVSNTLERERTNRVRHLIALDAPGSR